MSPGDYESIHSNVEQMHGTNQYRYINIFVPCLSSVEEKQNWGKYFLDQRRNDQKSATSDQAWNLGSLQLRE